MFAICLALWIYGSFYAKVKTPTEVPPTHQITYAMDWPFMNTQVQFLILGRFLGRFGAEKTHDGLERMVGRL